MVKLPVESFAVRRSVCAIPWDDHVSHLELVAPPFCQSMPFNRVTKLLVGGRALAFQGLTFISLDCATLFIGAEDPNQNVAVVK